MGFCPRRNVLRESPEFSVGKDKTLFYERLAMSAVVPEGDGAAQCYLFAISGLNSIVAEVLLTKYFIHLLLRMENY